ncbi:hypothetical protein [Micromonospora sp. NPDC005305]|uniref:hypothetical protein n=1 Tax=Micromonospora sp. NPDC005305 TaxID=3156875 RepID=UPI0033B9D180
MSTTPPRTMAAARASGVDRLLCAYAWLEPSFARYVYTVLIRPGLCAIPPAYGVDFVALARHTMASRRHRALVILLATLDVLLVVAAVPIVFALGGLSAGILLTAVIIIAGGAFLIFVLTGWHLYVSRTRASRMLSDPHGPGTSAPMLDKDLEERLQARAGANVIVFGHGIPFVGAGKLLNRWKVQVDTTKAGTDAKGNVRTILPVSAEELQKALSVTIRQAGIPDVKVHNRLFVAGNYATRVQGLLPQPEQPPTSSVDRSEIRKAIQNASETARTYLCIEKDSWAGELVVTVFVRAVEFGTDLFVEFYAYVLLPLHPVVASANKIPVTWLGRVGQAVRYAVPISLRLARCAPGTLLLMARWRWFIAMRPTRQRRLIRKLSTFNYGASGSIRAAVAAKQREWLFAYEDEEMVVQTLRTQILKVIVKYVKDHGIDTSDLERQQTRIFHQTYKIGDIKGRNVVIGDNTIFNDLAMGWSSAEDEDDDENGDGKGAAGS